jgi:hypothetical protein
MAEHDKLQFDRVEPTGGAGSGQPGLVCTACQRPLTDTYFEANGQVVCPSCRSAIAAEWNRGGAAGRFAKAIGLGVAAMIVCSILWYVVLKLTDSQWGILAIVVGLVVGGAVRKGSNGRGGWRYQALAIFLTYTAIVSSYVPFIIEGMRQDAAQVATADSSASAVPPATSVDSVTTTAAATAAAAPIGVLALLVGLVALVAILYATPFLMGIENLIGLLIIGFALYEAWKLNRKTELKITGPYRVAGAAGGGAAPA